MELPECPVCLQVYDGAVAVPRVLACGHSACEGCLLQLPRPFPHAIRCPSCTQLVSYPHLNGGAAALPKNIDLLRISLAADASAAPDPTSIKPNSARRSFVTAQPHYFVPLSWSSDLYSAWKDWVLPGDAVTLEADLEREEAGFSSVLRATVVSSCSSSSPCFCFRCCVKGNELASLVRVGSCSCLDNNVFVYGPTVQIVDCLSKLGEGARAELGLILKACLRHFRLCKSYGLWYNPKDSCVYLVCERHSDGPFNKLGALESSVFVNGDGLIGKMDSTIEDGLFIFDKIGLEICEAVISLHSEGLIAGCLGFSCFQSDNLARIYVDLSAVIITGRRVRMYIVENVSGFRGRIDDSQWGAYLSELLESHAFVSPEVLFVLLHNEGIVSQPGSLVHSVGYGSDSWSLGCLVLGVLIGKPFTELLVSYMCAIFQSTTENNVLDCLCWMEKVTFLLESKIGSKDRGLQEILCNCLHFDPKVRPHVTDLWKCFRRLVIKPSYESFVNFERALAEKKTVCCVALGDLCNLPKISIKGVGACGKDENSGGMVEQVGEMSGSGDLLQDLSTGNVKVKELQGHLDCVTGLAVGGGYLFSSSFDKTIHVWSLQDFSLVHSFRGHEHRVMALVFVDEQSYCISGDSGGGIFLWDISVPLRQEPMKKWYEQKDWRFSGIHALTVSGSQYLYTGSGDKSIKAWSLQDYKLSCTLSGHKSVVSALSVCEGVLYSGSWDGTIRLWSLNDHTPLIVFGENMTGSLSPVLSLTAGQHMLVAVHENGSIKIWKGDVAMRSRKVHDGAIFAVGMEGKWLFTGGLDKTLCIQELSGDAFQIDAIPFGSVTCDSVITALSYWQGKFFIGFADRLIKVHYYEK